MATRWRKHQMPPLPLDIVLEIAARSDPATLVRCAAACRDARRRVADPAFRRQLRLGRHADRFVPSLLRGHLEVRRLIGDYRSVALHLVDITGAGDTTTARLLTAADGFPPHPDGKAAGRRHEPVASRDGLLLVRTTDREPPLEVEELRVCDPATGHSLTLPPEPTFPSAAQQNWEPYALIVGDGGAASDGNGIRPFQLLKANLVMSDRHCYLGTHTLSSEDGAWGTYSEIRTPHLLGSRSLLRRVKPPLIAGGAVHWLCVTNKSAAYVLKLHIRTAQVTMTALPVSFPCSDDRGIDYLLATRGGGELMVLVAANDKISAWVQTDKPTAGWKQRTRAVVDEDAMRRFRITGWFGPFRVRLHWFAERSGLVLFTSNGYGCFWLDVRSMKIVRLVHGGAGILHRTGCLPYEMDLSSWVPTFTSTI
ncbi:unnamed protein product [Urochloa decumbens]|uniref:DUF7595 domain-containing protein n=1 Tax=Urochloa decumbens TaxID=240449 RepID=A0ABC9FYP1_9POAL